MPVHRRLALSILALAVLVASGDARADDRLPRVGVVVLLEVNVETERALRLSEQLGEALRDELQADVVAGREVARRLPVGGLPEECPGQPECVRDLAGRLDADQLLFLVVVAVGERYQLDVTWADAETAETVARGALPIEPDGPPAEAVFADAATRLLPGIAERREVKELPTERVEPPPAPVETKPTPIEAPVADTAAPGGRRMTTGSWIAAGISAGALAGSVGFGLSARSTHQDLEDGCPPACPQEDIDAVRTRAAIADALLGTALVAGGAAIYLYLTSGSGQEAPPVAVGAGPGGVQITWQGRF